MSTKRKILENILRCYFVSPYQPEIDIEKLLQQPFEYLNMFIKQIVVPDISRITDKDEYFKNVNNALKEGKFIKKKSYKQIMAEMSQPKKTDEEYRLEHIRRLESLYKCNNSKNLKLI